MSLILNLKTDHLTEIVLSNHDWLEETGKRESKQSLHPFLSLSNSQVESTGLCSRKYSESSELQLLKTFNRFPQVHLVMKQSVD